MTAAADQEPGEDPRPAGMLWMVFAVAVALGTVNAVDQPTRQTFIPEMVGRDHLQNAVSLNSVLTNASRAIGPAALAVTGFFSTAFMATGNTTLQLTADPQFRGRVMALWSVTFTGSTPIGGPIVGVTADSLGPRYGLALGALACLAATVLGTLTLRRMPPAERHARQPRELDWPTYQQAHELHR